MNENVRRRRKQKTLFSPDIHVNKMCQAIQRDFGPVVTSTLGPIQEYGPTDRYSRYFAKRQVADFTKKYCSEVEDTDDLESKTFEKFLNVNAHMGTFNGIEFPEVTRVTRNLPRRTKVLLRARSLSYAILGTSLRMDEWRRACRHSTGTSQGVPFMDTSVESKFTYPLSTTAEAKPIFEAFLKLDLTLSEALDLLNQGTDLTVGRYAIVDGSRATTVEKNNLIRRMIAIEPTVNMYLQQGLMVIMYQRMKAYGIDVQSLPNKHRVLAFVSSISHESATIDWSSASDCVLTQLIRWLLPPQWFAACDAVRCKQMTIQGQEVALNMFSTMGNAVTFPLETLVFWTLAQAVNISQDEHSNSLFPEWDQKLECSVFGDDCIVPVKIAEEFIATMTEFGMLLNKEKSFYSNEGFRESCGGDYLDGRDVRPFFLRAPVSTSLSALEPWLYSVLNGLIPKYISYFGPLKYVYDKAMFRLIAEIFDEHGLRLKLVPSYYPDDAGLKMSSDIARFSREYGFVLSRIAKSFEFYKDITFRNKDGTVSRKKAILPLDPGTVEFSFCEFRYLVLTDKDRYERCDELRYAMWLGKPTLLADFVPDPFVKVKRVGGYVVVKGTTSRWDVSRMDSRASER